MTEQHNGSVMVELAERCEAATGPDRGLDADIWRVVAPLPDGYRWQQVNDEWCQIGSYGVTDLYACDQRYTASLDAAMTLVPEGWARRVDYRPPNVIMPGGAPDTALALVYKQIGECHTGNARTEALALCAAALRARASSESTR